MKSRALILAQIAAAMLSSSSSVPPPFDPDRDKETAEEIKKRHRANLEKKGVKEYTIMGVTVYARNYKNALKKATRVANELLKH